MSLSQPHPERPYEEAGVKLGDEQFDRADIFGRNEGSSHCSAWASNRACPTCRRHASDELFSEIDQIGVRDGADLVVEGYDFAPTFSIWTTSRSASTSRDLGEGPWLVHHGAVQRSGGLHVPGEDGSVECVNVEHEEVMLVPRWIDCRRVTFKYGIGDEFIEVLKTLHKLGLDRAEPLRVDGAEVSPRDVVAAALPDPMSLGDRMTGKTCAGTWVTGTGIDGSPREVYLHHVVDNEETWGRDGLKRWSGRRRSTP